MTRTEPYFVMVITSSEDVTANLVIAALHERQVPIARVDPADVGSDLIFSAWLGEGGARWTGQLRTASRNIELERARAVYYRRPSAWRFDGLDPQARAFAIAEARYGLHGLLFNLPDCRYVNHPLCNQRADYKPAQLQMAARLGLPIPATLITNDLDAAEKFAAEHPAMIYKSFRGVPAVPEGPVAAIWTQRVDPADLDESLHVTAHLFQAEIPKSGDARVTVVGERVFAHRITSPAGMLDWRSENPSALLHTPIQVPSAVQAALHTYLARFGLIFGCFDFALLEDASETHQWIFVECNPNGQWGWLPNSDAIAATFADTLLKGWQR
ncbi:ATP-grasp ribosomal peptide maturase [Nonomuraea sp. NPDC059023]|uniref:ATP-grasp ribosomal peptide maturase n=1 Tax=unclassified Nonomuraea TaxID=2593643 RepID=UPI0036A0E858